MKLKKLTLKNIASIEDAEILFDQAPLDREPVFLICGDTGSGKTTILDGICLALYGETPRMNKTAKEIYTDSSLPDNRSEELATNDSRQLMRRNTTEAWSIVEFTGTNEHEYRAEWYVARGHKRLNGNIQSVKWSLEDLTEQHTWTKIAEIRQEMQQAIGLTFAQYCRTALLAQGDFTLFLQSREAEKSEILEKLTGTEIYSQIGAQIFATTRDKKKEYEEQQKRLTDIQILSEEELRQISDNIREQQEKLKALEQQGNEAKDKLDWLNRDRELEEQAHNLEKHCQETDSRLQSQEIKEKQKILTLWTETEDIRAVLKQKQKTEQERNECHTAGNCLFEEYQKLDNGLATLQLEQTRQKNKQKKLETELNTCRHLVPMFEQSQTIISSLHALMKSEQRIGNMQEELRALEKQLPEYQKKLEEKRSEWNQLALALENRQKEIAAIRGQIGSEEYSRLQEEQKKLTEELLRLTDAQKVILLLKEKVEQKNKVAAELQDTLDKLQKGTSQTNACQEKNTQKTLLFKQAEELYEKQQKAVSDWARELRQELHAGDHCPVCGSLIRENLHEEDFLSVLAPLKEDLDRKKQEKEKAEKELFELQATLKSLNESLNRLQQEQQKATDAYHKVYSQTVEACQACGILRLQKDTQAQVDRRILQNKEQQNETGVRMKALQAQINRLNQYQQEKDKLQIQADRLRVSVNELELQISKLRKSQEEQQKVCQQEMQEKELTEKTLLPQLLWENREELWQSDRNSLIRKLQTETEQYNRHTEELKNLTETLHLQEVVLEHVERLKKQVLQFFPQWSEYQSQTGEPLRQPDMQWSQFTQKTAALKERERLAEQSLQQTVLTEENFFRNHPALSRETVGRLTALNGKIMEDYREEIRKLQERQIEYRSNLQQTQTAQKEHHQRKPQFRNEDTPESLTVSIREISTGTAQINQDIGRCQAQLENNRKNMERSENLRQEIERCKNDYFQWNRLCALFGDDKGKKFRNIAQSFVLKELLERANFYLGHLTERYELSCQAGSLTILLIDWYQGGTARPASTLSGGEGFLVSLSLALGLSSLNRQSLSVDTLFIDEGFGTLSSDYLNVVMDTLERLHQLGGKKVGIISHVEGLRERIKTQIRVTRIDQGRSRIEVINAN